MEYGDERIPEQRIKLKEISPLVRASEINIPLMVVTGANDPRVPASEAEQIVAAVPTVSLPGICWPKMRAMASARRPMATINSGQA